MRILLFKKKLRIEGLNVNRRKNESEVYRKVHTHIHTPPHPPYPLRQQREGEENSYGYDS